MSTNSKIEWCDATWNPIRGCSKVSAGCEHCYAIAVAARFSGAGQPYEGLAKRKPVNWIVCGGESGPGARPMRRTWAVSLRNQCSDAGVPFFFKQWGGVRKSANGRKLDGRTYDEFPEFARA